ncbi:MAG: PQQ-binding-like beta-propeller repeat protein [Acidimicrobiaceae bacterium]|nr:PQQ-binding-like beta-propeller repeat protein [Acidimicrobiaceae bacterium]
MNKPGVPAAAALLILAVLAAGCTEFSTSSDDAGTCLGDTDTQTIDEMYRQVDYLWHRELGGDMLTNPIASGGQLYVATSGIDILGNGHVFALDAATGEELWRYQTLNDYGFAEDAAAAVLIEGDLYVVPQSDGYLYRLDSTTGELLWRTPHVGRGSQPAMSGGFVYTKPSSGGPVHALHTDTGEVAWTYSQTNFFGYQRLAVSEDAVYGTTWLDIRALDKDSGQLRWVFDGNARERGLRVADGIVIASGTLYELDENPGGSLYAIDAATGDLMWRRGLSAQSIVLRNDTVYAGTGESPLLANDHPGPVRALDIATGEDRWRSETCGRPFAGPDGVLYVVNGWRFSALNEHTGERLWSYDLSPAPTPMQPGDEAQATPSEWELLVAGSHSSAWLTAPVWKSDEVHLGSADGRVFALDALTGELRWQSDVQTPIATEYFRMMLAAYIHPAPAVGDEVVYVTNGGLVAFSAHSR